MLGAMLGDMIGSPYEFRPVRSTEFPLFREDSVFTDDTVMTAAVADAFLACMDESGTVTADDDTVRRELVRKMKEWGRRYPDAGYGGRFYRWLFSKTSLPYNSWGNGSAMRVSAAGWIADTIGETRRLAALSAEVTHNHPEGIKGAEAAASAVFLARTGKTKEEIRLYIEKEFGYDCARTIRAIRRNYMFEVSCQRSVPEAIIAFLEGDSYEQAVRLAVSLGGDSDTQACIAGSIAEAYYGIPQEIAEQGILRLPVSFRDVLERFEKIRRAPARAQG